MLLKHPLFIKRSWAEEENQDAWGRRACGFAAVIFTDYSFRENVFEGIGDFFSGGHAACGTAIEEHVGIDANLAGFYL